MIFDNLSKVFVRYIIFTKQFNHPNNGSNSLPPEFNILIDQSYSVLDYRECKICGLLTGINNAKITLKIPFIDSSLNIVMEYLDTYNNGILVNSCQYYNGKPQKSEFSGQLSTLLNKHNSTISYL